MLGIVIIIAAAMIINYFVGNDNFIWQTKESNRLDIFNTEFGQTYKAELEKMNGVVFFIETDDATGEKILKIKTNDTIDENIVLTHMVYSNLRHIMPNVDSKNICIIAYDESGIFFKWNNFNLDFALAFTRKDYINAVEKKEKMLYNHSAGVE